jgi:hypothetical protein
MTDESWTESWICPQCQKEYIAVLTLEDLDDGCANGVTMCFDCFANHPRVQALRDQSSPPNSSKGAL